MIKIKTEAPPFSFRGTNSIPSVTQRHSTHSTLTTHTTQRHPLPKHTGLAVLLWPDSVPAGPLFYSSSPQPMPGQPLHSCLKIQPKYPTPHLCALELLGITATPQVSTSPKNYLRAFPGVPAINTGDFYSRGVGSTPGWGTKLPQAVQRSQEKKCLCIPSGWFHSLCSFSSMC